MRGAPTSERHGADCGRSREARVPAAARQAGAGARRGVAGGARAGVRGAARAVGLRQVDLAHPDRRLSPGRGRPDRDRRQADRRAGPRPRHRFSAFRAVSLEDGARQHPVRAGAARHAARRARDAGPAFHRSGRPHRLRGQLSHASVRRHAAAHRARAHARLRSENPADGRAVRRARRADAPPDAVRASRHLAAHAQDGDFRHPRRAGGGLSRRPRRRHVGAVKAIVDTRFDKNETGALRGKQFVDKVDELWNLVRDEAIKAQAGRMESNAENQAESGHP